MKPLLYCPLGRGNLAGPQPSTADSASRHQLDGVPLLMPGLAGVRYELHRGLEQQSRAKP